MDKQKQRMQSLNPLITPSASPAPRSASLSFFPRASEGPSPTKRPRLPATRSSSSVSTPPAVSFSNQTYHIENGGDLHDARRASSSRVLDIWSSLAERYNRPLADDDIVDLRTGDIIKDRNVLRSTSVDYDIGFFGDSQAHRDGTDTPTDEGADSEDELDSFAPGADISDELEMERLYREGVLPVKEMDPADAEDLREFLEAENRRREVFGNEGEEAESYGEREEEEEDSSLAYEEDGKSLDELEHGLSDKDELPEPDLDQEEKKDDLSQADDSNPLEDGFESGSEDELGAWDEQDEGSTVYALVGDLDPDDASGVIALPTVPSLSPEPLDLATHYNSNDESKESSYPVEPRSKSRAKSKIKKNYPPVQLHTPPQSSSSTSGNTPDNFSLYTGVPIPSSSGTKSTSKTTGSSGTETKSLKKVRKTKWEAEVIIPSRSSSKSSHNKSPRQKTTRSQADAEVIIDLSDDNHAGPQTTSPQLHKTSKGKGKKKADLHRASPASSDRESDDPITLSPELPKRLLASEPERLSTPLLSTPSKSRKRKRVLSSSLSTEPEHHENEREESNSELSVVSPEIGLIDFADQRHRTYAIGQMSPSPKAKSYNKRIMRSHKAHEQALDEEEQPVSPLIVPKRSRSRAHIPMPLEPPTDVHHYSYSETYSPDPQQDPDHIQHHNRGHSTHSVPPPQYAPQTQGPQAQFQIAQAMQHLLYLMSASGHPQSHPTMGPPTWPHIPMSGPSSLPFVQPPFDPRDPPYSTPIHHRHRSRSDFGTSSPVASTYSSAYPTPSHQRSYNNAFSPSSATLPPSSPYETSSPNAAASRPTSLARGRSKSKGRRVSFVVDDDRSARFEHSDPASDGFEPLELSSPSKRAYESSKRGRSKSRKRDASADHAVELRSSSSEPKPRKKGKGKGQSVAKNLSEEAPDANEPRTRSSEDHRIVRRLDRAQTPGPPSTPAPSRSRSRVRHDR